MSLREDGFGIEPEIAAQAVRLGLRLYEVGVSYSGHTYAEGKNHVARRPPRAACYCAGLSFSGRTRRTRIWKPDAMGEP